MGGWGQQRGRSPYPFLLPSSNPGTAINPIKFSAAEYFLGGAVENVRNVGQRSTAAKIISRFLSRNYWYRFKSTLPLRPGTSEEG